MNIALQLHSFRFPCWECVREKLPEEVEADIMRRMSGKNTLRKLRKEGGWGCIPNEVFEPLEAALQVLEDDLNCAKKELWVAGTWLRSSCGFKLGELFFFSQAFLLTMLHSGMISH